MAQRFRSKIDGKLVAIGVALPMVTGLVFLANGLLYGGSPWWTALPLALARS